MGKKRTAGHNLVSSGGLEVTYEGVKSNEWSDSNGGPLINIVMAVSEVRTPFGDVTARGVVVLPVSVQRKLDRLGITV
ncbi:hypothetical protein TNCV_1907671 [Trichonephila clavipes]|nr:hypothetical protein TNCV_1907671 [Trichonephila clavipes]